MSCSPTTGVDLRAVLHTDQPVRVQSLSVFPPTDQNLGAARISIEMAQAFAKEYSGL